MEGEYQVEIQTAETTTNSYILYRRLHRASWGAAVLDSMTGTEGTCGKHRNQERDER
jgi:hypothetical protein